MNGEANLYVKSKDYIEFLRNWTSHTYTLPDRMIELMCQLVERNFFGMSDLYLMKAWLEDLSILGYQFPPIIPQKRFAYLMQTESNLPPGMENLKTYMTDVFILSWKAPPTEIVEGVFYYFDNKTTWGSGRNLLLEKFYEHEKKIGRRYDYAIFMDDDLNLWYDKLITYLCFKNFNQILKKV